MTKDQQQQVITELLAACVASLDRFKALSVTENADVRVQLSQAITRAKMDPARWHLLDAPKASVGDPFARFRSGEAFGLRRKQ